MLEEAAARRSFLFGELAKSTMRRMAHAPRVRNDRYLREADVT
jgi:hypothetical protein